MINILHYASHILHVYLYILHYSVDEKNSILHYISVYTTLQFWRFFDFHYISNILHYICIYTTLYQYDTTLYDDKIINLCFSCILLHVNICNYDFV